MCYGGSEDSWLTEHNVTETLPEFVAQLDKEQASIRKEDADKNPELLQKIRESGADRPEVTLQSMLNMKREREVLDAMAAALGGLAQIGSYEHDGLFLYNPAIDPGDEGAGKKWRAEVLSRIRSSVAAPV